MEINVSQQLKAPVGYVRDYEISGIIDILGQGKGVLTEGGVKFTRTNRGILVQGKLKTNVSFECSRCLQAFECLLNINIEEEYFPIIDINTGIPADIPEEPGSFTIDEHHILDLREAIRQNALLAIPMKPLCREDCVGLCPNCGQDLNTGSCKCETENIDPRWAKLASLTAAVKKNIKKNKRKKEME